MDHGPENHDGLTLIQLESITQTLSLSMEVVTLFGIGCSLRTNHLVNLEKELCLGLLLQTMALPFIGFAISKLLHLTTLDAISVLMTTTAPVAGYSSVLTFWACGNIGLGVLLATLSTTLSIGLLPWWFSVYSATWTNQIYFIAYPEDVAIYILATVVPVGLGLFLHHIIPKGTIYITKVCSGAFLIKVVMTSALFILYHPEQFVADWHAWLGTFLIPSLGSLIGFIFAFVLRLPYEACVAISLAMGASNAAMVVSLAIHSVKDPSTLRRVLQVPGIYSIFAPLQGTVWSMLFRCFKTVEAENPTVFGEKYELATL